MAKLLTWLFLLVFTLMGLVFLAGLLIALTIYTVWSTLLWPFTGRKPKVAAVWQNYSHMRQQFSNRAPGSRFVRPHTNADDVIDVQAHPGAPDTTGDKRVD